jgi:hypothetical protein
VGRYARILAAQATERFDMKNDRIGSSFEDFLREEGIYEEVEAGAIKKVIACMIESHLDGHACANSRIECATDTA